MRCVWTVASRALTVTILLATLAINGRQVQAMQEVRADLLIVGGTESACAAAVQAARMGVPRIVLVNDIEWLGGQFSAESLVAIDENTDRPGIRHEPPIPRHGAFREVIERIEAVNIEKYGVARPGNTRVITTCRPADAARVFREWLAPYVKRGQLQIFSHYEPHRVTVSGNRVTAVQFAGRRSDQTPLRVEAGLTIDASDWGDVVRLSGAAYEFGPDLKSRYGEPLAPEQRDGYPVTDMNPITYCMVIEETDDYVPVARPPGYDARHYRSHRWPKDPLWLYETRRLVDHYHFTQIQHPDVLLLCFPAFDYPLDVYPQAVAAALEATEPGASRRNIVELTPAQRRIIFEDAKQYSLGFLHYLQTEVHDAMSDTTHSYRRFVLTEEFGTADRMPFKPYVRESLRLQAMHMMRQQDTMGIAGTAQNFSAAMYHDAVAVWQFEYDFHPTKREFLVDGDPGGPWRCGFRPGRTWGPPYSGRSVFPLRSLIPITVDGLLGAQKNLGFSSIVSSAVRLHDTSMVIGQACGACAAVALNREIQPRDIPFNRDHLLAVQSALMTVHGESEPSMLWPFRDLSSENSCFTAVNMLAVQHCLPLRADDVDFRPHQPATREWMHEVVTLTNLQQDSEHIPEQTLMQVGTRGEFAERWWQIVRNGPWKPYQRLTKEDADGDGIPDPADALCLDPQNTTLLPSPPDPETDGIPNLLSDDLTMVRQFNFGGPGNDAAEFEADHGQVFTPKRNFGWTRDLSAHHRLRGMSEPPADTFLFTRSHDVWECMLPEGNYTVEFCVGDAEHVQAGQNVTVEGQAVLQDHTTMAGRFAERRVDVHVTDGRLTVEIGRPGSTTNTCLNWLRISTANR